MNWLDAVWYSGYCNEAVEAASTTPRGDEGSKERVAWLHEHLPDCQDCQCANLLKSMEAMIAEQLGFFEEFTQGGDVVQQPGYHQALHRQMTLAVQPGIVDDRVFAWMERVVNR